VKRRALAHTRGPEQPDGAGPLRHCLVLRMRNPKSWVSLWIILVVGLHTLPVLRNEGQPQTIWPWGKWAMDKDPARAGPRDDG
jgi:hypothetical protein